MPFKAGMNNEDVYNDLYAIDESLLHMISKLEGMSTPTNNVIRTHARIILSLARSAKTLTEGVCEYIREEHTKAEDEEANLKKLAEALRRFVPK